VPKSPFQTQAFGNLLPDFEQLSFAMPPEFGKSKTAARIEKQRQFMMELEFRGIRQAAPLPMPQLGSEVFTSRASDTERLVQGG
jgi:hypothetical protein